MVENRQKFLIDFQINMSLEVTEREQERGMIIPGNCRRSPKDQEAVSGINKDLKVSVLPQPNSCFL